jgi:hypothetical protein
MAAHSRFKEQIEGVLNIRCVNKSVRSRRYTVLFARYRDFQRATQRPRDFIGEQSLSDFLIEMQDTKVGLEQRTERAQAWVQSATVNGTILLPNIFLSHFEAESFRP